MCSNECVPDHLFWKSMLVCVWEGGGESSNSIKKSVSLTFEDQCQSYHETGKWMPQFSYCIKVHRSSKDAAERLLKKLIQCADHETNGSLSIQTISARSNSITVSSCRQLLLWVRLFALKANQSGSFLGLCHKRWFTNFPIEKKGSDFSKRFQPRCVWLGKQLCVN